MTQTTERAPEERPEGRTELKRVMGPKLLLLFIVGDILGAGIYAVTGQMAAIVGGLVWLPFIIAFIVVFFGPEAKGISFRKARAEG